MMRGKIDVAIVISSRRQVSLLDADGLVPIWRQVYSNVLRKSMEAYWYHGVQKIGIS